MIEPMLWVISLTLIGFLIYGAIVLSSFYWGRVFVVSIALLIWAGVLLGGFIASVVRSCTGASVSLDCGYQVFVGMGIVCLLGIPWMMVVRASVEWLKRYPPGGKTLFQRI